MVVLSKKLDSSPGDMIILNNLQVDRNQVSGVCVGVAVFFSFLTASDGWLLVCFTNESLDEVNNYG
jgi:hypothetical protein